MLLSQEQFRENMANNQLRIALIGMSNIGKSHWAQQLASLHGFNVFEVDKVIQEQLGFSSLRETAKWMGHPYGATYNSKSKQYLACESQVTLLANSTKTNLVLDTTGSVIHLGEKTIKEISNKYLVVYLKAGLADIDTLVVRFTSSPKPIIWGDHYKQYDGKTHIDSLALSYPNLLEARAKLYTGFADVVLEVAQLKDTHTTDLLAVLHKILPESV